MTTPKPADAHARLRPTLPTPSMVTLLQAIESYPAVTVLMSTTPARAHAPGGRRTAARHGSRG